MDNWKIMSLSCIMLSICIFVQYIYIYHIPKCVVLFLYALCALRNLISTGWFMVWFIMINATFNNILAISWQSGLLAEETGVPGENHRPVASH